MSDPTDPDHFRKVLGHFPTGVTVVTAIDDGRPTGLAIGSFCSVSLDPPLVAFCPTKTSSSWTAVENAGAFCVNVMTKDQMEVCGVFASKSDDKFAGVDWTEGVTGQPRIAGSLAWMDCTIENAFDGGDHWIVVGRVAALDLDEGDADPLMFYKGGYGTFS